MRVPRHHPTPNCHLSVVHVLCCASAIHRRSRRSVETREGRPKKGETIPSSLGPALTSGTIRRRGTHTRITARERPPSAALVGASDRGGLERPWTRWRGCHLEAARGVGRRSRSRAARAPRGGVLARGMWIGDGGTYASRSGRVCPRKSGGEGRAVPRSGGCSLPCGGGSPASFSTRGTDSRVDLDLGGRRRRSANRTDQRSVQGGCRKQLPLWLMSTEGGVRMRDGSAPKLRRDEKIGG